MGISKLKKVMKIVLNRRAQFPINENFPPRGIFTQKAQKVGQIKFKKIPFKILIKKIKFNSSYPGKKIFFGVKKKK